MREQGELLLELLLPTLDFFGAGACVAVAGMHAVYLKCALLRMPWAHVSAACREQRDADEARAAAAMLLAGKIDEANLRAKTLLETNADHGLARFVRAEARARALVLFI